MERDLYLPIPFIEALGRATVARAQLELSLNLLVAILALEPRRRISLPNDPFETKLDYLGSISGSRLLKHDWWRDVRRLASAAEKLNRQYRDAAISSLYSRGGGFLEETMRPIAAEVNLVPPPLAMTPAKLDAVAGHFKDLALGGSRLAADLLTAAKALSLTTARRE